MLIKSILILDAEWHFKNGKGSNDKKKTKKKTTWSCSEIKLPKEKEEGVAVLKSRNI